MEGGTEMDDRDQSSSVSPAASVYSRVARKRLERGSRRHRQRGTDRLSPRRLLRLVGFVLVAAGLVLGGRIPFFYLRSWWVGHHLVAGALGSSTRPHPRKPAQNAYPWPPGLLSVLQIPALGVSAPVLQGTSDAQLNVAVGHLKSSVLPGQAGTSILAAHDVTWFHRINHLKPGALIKVVEPGKTLTFRVTKSAVVHTGTPVYNSSNSSIVLEACYPLNALYLTPYRYLVWATLVSSTPKRTGQPSIAPNTHYSAWGIPPAIQAQGLTLATNDMPMGTLSIQGDPTQRWRQSNAPLNAADATTTLFFAVLHIAGAQDSAAWTQIAPKLPYATLGPLAGQGVAQYLSSAQETESVADGSLHSTALTVGAQLDNGDRVTLTLTTRVTSQHQVAVQSFRVNSLN